MTPGRCGWCWRSRPLDGYLPPLLLCSRPGSLPGWTGAGTASCWARKEASRRSRGYSRAALGAGTPGRSIGADHQERQAVLGGDAGHQRLGPVTAGHAEQVRAIGTALPASAATSTVPGSSSIATSAPSTCALSFSPNLVTFPRTAACQAPSAWAARSASIAARIAWAGTRPLAPAGPGQRTGEPNGAAQLCSHTSTATVPPGRCRRADLLDVRPGQQYRQAGLCRAQLPDLAEQHQVKHPHGVAVHQSPQLRCHLPEKSAVPAGSRTGRASEVAC